MKMDHPFFIIFDRPDKTKKCLFWLVTTKETFMLWFIMNFFCLELKKGMNLKEYLDWTDQSLYQGPWTYA